MKTDHEEKIRRIRTVCNPVNINYRYRAPMRSRKSADPAVDQSFFLRKAWYKPVEALKRRIYQYLDEIPASVELLPMEGFDAPDIRFYNKDGLDLYTNVYRRNIMDMAYHKITDDGMTHTSSAMTAMEAKGLPVTTADGVRSVDYRYERSTDLPLWATDGHTAYSMSLTGDVTVSEVRFGPFETEDVTVSGGLPR